jgi:hypothetical protein
MEKLPGSAQDKATVMGTLCAAYYNLGVSFETLQKFDFAKQAYERSLLVCSKYLPENTQLIQNLTIAIAAVT